MIQLNIEIVWLLKAYVDLVPIKMEAQNAIYFDSFLFNYRFLNFDNFEKSINILLNNY